MKVKKFIRRYMLTVKKKDVTGKRAPPTFAIGLGGTHYRMTLKSPLLGKMKFDYFAGSAAREVDLELPSLLECLQCDSMLDPTQSLGEFCSTYGYDVNLRETEETYLACIKQVEKCQKFFGIIGLRDLQSIEW